MKIGIEKNQDPHNTGFTNTEDSNYAKSGYGEYIFNFRLWDKAQHTYWNDSLELLSMG